MTASRREFLKGAATVGAATATSGVLGIESALAEETAATLNLQYDVFAESAVELGVIDPADIVATADYDVVVVGAGAAGVPAAMSALEAGATVAVLQKEEVPISQGTGCNGVVASESEPEALVYLLKKCIDATGSRCDREQMKLFIEHSGEVARWMAPLVSEGGYEVEASSREATINDYTYVTAGLNSHGKPDNFGNLISSMAVTAENHGVVFYYQTPAVQLVQDESGRVTGVIGHGPDGYVQLNAAKGVILATGDYQNNSQMVLQFCPDLAVFDKKQFNKTGDGHLLGMLAGGQIEPIGHCKMVHDADSGPMRDEPFLTVNDNGERFMDETTLYEYRNDIMRSQPNPGWCSQIFDSTYVEQVTNWGGRPTDEETILNYIPGAVEEPKGVIPGLIDTHKCDTLEELADELGIPADALISSVERYNELAEGGMDLDFGKDPVYLQPITQPPFYGIHKHYRVSAIPSGILITPEGAVKDATGQPIPGLFAAGNCSGQFYGSTDYPMDFPGMSLGRCITFGYLTGKYVAEL